MCNEERWIICYLNASIIRHLTLSIGMATSSEDSEPSETTSRPDLILTFVRQQTAHHLQAIFAIDVLGGIVHNFPTACRLQQLLWQLKVRRLQCARYRTGYRCARHTGLHFSLSLRGEVVQQRQMRSRYAQRRIHRLWPRLHLLDNATHAIHCLQFEFQTRGRRLNPIDDRRHGGAAGQAIEIASRSIQMLQLIRRALAIEIQVLTQQLVGVLEMLAGIGRLAGDQGGIQGILGVGGGPQRAARLALDQRGRRTAGFDVHGKGAIQLVAMLEGLPIIVRLLLDYYGQGV